VQLGDGPVRVLWGVNASEPRQLFGGKTLRAEGHAIDASGAIFIEAAALDCARMASSVISASLLSASWAAIDLSSRSIAAV